MLLWKRYGNNKMAAMRIVSLILHLQLYSHRLNLLYFLDKIRCQLSRRGRGIASFTRRILSLHSSAYNLCAAVVLSWFCCVLKLLQNVDLLYRTFNTVQKFFK